MISHPNRIIAVVAPTNVRICESFQSRNAPALRGQLLVPYDSQIVTLKEKGLL
jgi:hypothetical protein